MKTNNSSSHNKSLKRQFLSGICPWMLIELGRETSISAIKLNFVNFYFLDTMKIQRLRVDNTSVKESII